MNWEGRPVYEETGNGFKEETGVLSGSFAGSEKKGTVPKAAAGIKVTIPNDRQAVYTWTASLYQTPYMAWTAFGISGIYGDALVKVCGLYAAFPVIGNDTIVFGVSYRGTGKDM